MMHLKSVTNLGQALDVVAQASAISVVDGSKLVAMPHSSSNDADSDACRPGAAAHESHSGGIVGTLDGLFEKADGQLDAASMVEPPAKTNIDFLKQSLFDDPRRLQRTSKH